MSFLGRKRTFRRLLTGNSVTSRLQSLPTIPFAHISVEQGKGYTRDISDIKAFQLVARHQALKIGPIAEKAGVPAVFLTADALPLFVHL
jgi:hypothetical protein